MTSSVLYPANSCQAYHTPSFLQERLKNMPYNKHLCFVHRNISFYCLLSEYVSFRPDGSFVPPHTLDYVARQLRNSLLQVNWPGRLDKQFMESEMGHIFAGIDSTFLDDLRGSVPSFLREHGYSCCSVALMLCQNGTLWGVQLGKNRIGLCAVPGPLGDSICISPCNEHSYESNTEQTRLAQTGLSHYDLSEFFQYQHSFMPTRCIGNINLKEDYHKTCLQKAHSSPVIAVPDVWGPIDIQQYRLQHAFIINDDLYKVFERHCMFNLCCPVMEKVAEFIVQDHTSNDNSKQHLFNDCGRRIIENVLKAVGPSQLSDLYRHYNIIDMGVIITNFDGRYYPSLHMQEAPGIDEEPRSNPSGPLGVVDPYSPGHTINPVLYPLHSLNGPDHSVFHQQKSVYERPQQEDPPSRVSRSTSDASALRSPQPSSQPSSLPPAGHPAYLKFDRSNPIWGFKSLEDLMK